ncbi:MAG: flavin reductase [Lachnospiraceae bacterium]
MGFKEIDIKSFTCNPFTKIGQEWFLITAGNQEQYNTMTAAWGNMGYLWNKNVVTTYIRPQRYTKEFVDTNELCTISFFDESYKDALTYCGRHCGRTEDKVSNAGLTPYYIDGTVGFQEATMMLVCKKLYHQYLLPENFEESQLAVQNYPEEDYHMMYISEVVKVLVREK